MAAPAGLPLASSLWQPVLHDPSLAPCGLVLQQDSPGVLTQFWKFGGEERVRDLSAAKVRDPSLPGLTLFCSLSLVIRDGHFRTVTENS